MTNADHESRPAHPRARALAWSWSGALLGGVYAIPAALATFNDVTRGVAFAVGVLPAAVVGLAPRRRERRAVAVLGGVVGVAILIGSLLSHAPVVAVAGIFVLGVGAVVLTQRVGRAGQIVLVLGMPMVGIGFSYTDSGEAAGLALLMIGGAVYAWVISLAWPERNDEPLPKPPPPPTLDYGVRLGLAGATAAAIGFALDLDHVGWACAAALLVMRPSAEMQTLRSVGRIASVCIGAALGSIVVRLAPPAAGYSAIVIIVIAAVAATRESRWYITATFTTFLVFVLLLYANPSTAASRFGERVGETLLGVGIAYLYGLAVPALLRVARPS